MGIEEITELRSCNLPPWERNYELAVSLLSMQSTKGMKSAILGLVVPTGKPRYVNGKVPTLQPKI